MPSISRSMSLIIPSRALKDVSEEIIKLNAFKSISLFFITFVFIL